MSEPIRDVAEAVAALGALPVPAGSEPQPDGITRLTAPTQVLHASWEDPHDSPLHHSYTTPHDLPETGGAR